MSTGDHFNANEVIDEEYRQILARRIKALADTPVDPFRHGTPERQALDDAMKPDGNDERGRDAHLCERNLVGLALSGGGIRSATFGLGVIQGLADLGLLKFCDYLSTVSGGGYIGSWLTAWIKREGDLNNVAKQLRPLRTDQAEAQRGFQSLRSFIPPGTIQENEPEAICHLREYSNYLSPRLSLFSKDSWTLVAVYLRNLLANQLALLPALLVLLLIVKGATVSLSWPHLAGSSLQDQVLPALLLLFLLVGAGSLTRSLFLVTDRKEAAAAAPEAGTSLLRWTISSFSLAAILITWLSLPNLQNDSPSQSSETLTSINWTGRFHNWKWLAGEQSDPRQSDPRQSDPRQSDPRQSDPKQSASNGAPAAKRWTFSKKTLFGVAVLPAVIQLIGSLFLWHPGRSACAFVSGAATGGLYYLALAYVLWPRAFDPAFVATLGPPLFLLAHLAGNILEAALLGNTATEQEREWRSRLNAWELILITGWGAVFGISLYGPGWLRDLPASVQAGLSAGWLTTAVGGVLAAKSSQTDAKHGRNWLDIVSLITPYLFLVGLICALSTFAEFLVTADTAPPGAGLLNLDWFWFWGSLIVSSAVAVVASWRVDVNEFSLNAMYANRLTRCFLGASRHKDKDDWQGVPGHSHSDPWNPNRVTGFDPADDLPLTALQIGRTPEVPVDPEKPESESTYWGPFPLINTALNLLVGDRLAWQERKAESFLLSPNFCGAKSLGYRESTRYAAGYDSAHPLTLGRAVAISGAAANPSMGYHSSPAVSALLTVFNVRLGWWLPNPRIRQEAAERKQWMSRGPRFLLKWLAVELFSLTGSDRRFLNVSDGGHFENLGVYELVRRRCRLIIAVDAGADPDYQFEDLGGLIRKCRTDFGVDIEIDVTALKPEPGAQHSRRHCVAGTIRYDHLDPTAPVGTLIYIKPSVTGDEPGDIQHYARQHASFPHQPTLDQFFSESQFESYRELGYHCVVETLQTIARRLEFSKMLELDREKMKSSSCIHAALKHVREAHWSFVENFIYCARTSLLTPPSDVTAKFLESVDGFVEMQKHLRDSSGIEAARISRQLYPDLPWDTARGELAIKPEELHSASLMVQVMESAFVGLNLEQDYAHPLNAGWMNLFHRWSNTPLLQRYWPILRNEYSQTFVKFCQRELSLKAEYSELEHIDTFDEELWQRMLAEFHGQWPSEKGRHRSLSGLREDAVQFKTTDGDGTTRSVRAIWCLRVRPPKTLAQCDHPGCAHEHCRDPLMKGCVAGLVGLRPLTRVRKLTQAEFDRLSSEIERAEPGSPENLLDLRDGELEQYTRNGSTPPESVLDSRRGFELVVWVRPGFRHLKAGENLLQKVEEELRNNQELKASLNSGGEFRLVVFYPRTTSTQSGDRFPGIKGLWLTFFSFYGYRRPGRSWPYADRDEVLIRDLPRDG